MSAKSVIALLCCLAPLPAAAASHDTNDVGRPTSLVAVPTVPFAVSLNYTVNASTPVDQNGRLFRDAVPSTCAAPKAFPGESSPGSAFRRVTSVPLYNRATSTVCATIVLTPDASCDINLFASAYLGSYSPSSLSTNYLGDIGSSFSIPPSSPSFSFQVLVPGSSAIVVNLNDSNTGTANGVACTVTVSSDQLFTELPVSLQRFEVD